MDVIVVRGAGDLATGTLLRLHNAGYFPVALEVPLPTVIRRTVSLAECLFEGETVVEGVKASRAESVEEALSLSSSGVIPVLPDPDGLTIPSFKPVALVDAILAKKNLGTTKEMAPLVIALGPGFTAGVDCDRVIETKRGHYLGSIIRKGSAEPNSGIPGVIAGHGRDRVVRSPGCGVFRGRRRIGEVVKQGEVIATVGDVSVEATIDGVLRGMLHDGIPVTSGFKIADIDPRGERDYIFSVSDKARAVAGSVLEVVDAFFHARMSSRQTG